MKTLKKTICALLLVTMFGTPTQSLNGVEYCSEVAGCGYEQCRSAPCLTPAIALGVIALVAIIAVAVQNSSGGHCHTHAHECN